MKILSLTLLIVLTTGWPAWSQGTKPKTLDELVAYSGADRQKIILEGAKAEGKVVWYTSLSGNYREIVEAFKKKYPEIQIEVYRAGSSDVTERLLNEARAGRYLADALETTPGSLILLRENGILKPYASPELAKYPEAENQGGWRARLLGHRSRSLLGLRLQHTDDRFHSGPEELSGLVKA